MSSFAARARAGREEGAGAFTFPKFEGWVRLKGWKFGLTKKSKKPMFTLELKILEDVTVLSRVEVRGKVLTPEDIRGKIVKERVIVDPAMDWQFDRFLAYLEDSGMDLSTMDDTDPQFKDIQEALEYLEDQGQKIKVSLDPQEDDARYYRLKFLEVQKLGEGVGGPVPAVPAVPAQAVASVPAAPAAPAAPVAPAQVVPAPVVEAASAIPASEVVQPVVVAPVAPVAPAAPAAEVPPAAPAKKKKPWEK